MSQNSNDVAPRAAITPGAIYTTTEAAELCRVRPATIRAYVRQGLIRGRGRPFRILGSELLKLAGAA